MASESTAAVDVESGGEGGMGMLRQGGAKGLFKVAVALGLASAITGCSSVKMVQREGCWVRRTEKWYGSVKEELGPCARPAPAWVADRHTRLVQECVAQADYRWQTKALEAFTRGAPWPEQTGHEEVLQLCMNEAARAYIVENDELKSRLAEVKEERESLKGALARNEEHLRESHDRLATSLGEAALRPPSTATATATSSSDGKASTEATESRSTPATAPAITWVTTGTPGAPACATPQVQAADGAQKGVAAESITARRPRPKAVSSEKKRDPAPLCAPAPESPKQPQEEAKPTAAATVAQAADAKDAAVAQAAPAAPLQDAAKAAPVPAPAK